MYGRKKSPYVVLKVKVIETSLFYLEIFYFIGYSG